MTTRLIVIFAVSVATVIGMFLIGRLSDGKPEEPGKDKDANKE